MYKENTTNFYVFSHVHFMHKLSLINRVGFVVRQVKSAAMKRRQNKTLSLFPEGQIRNKKHPDFQFDPLQFLINDKAAISEKVWSILEMNMTLDLLTLYQVFVSESLLKA